MSSDAPLLPFPKDPLELLDAAIRELDEKKNLLQPETARIALLALYEKRRRLLTAGRPTPEKNETGQEDEIRLVTVVFIDVADSTEIAERIDFENWRTLIGEAHRIFAETIERWGGEIGQYLGDGLLCFFGARRSRGNDAIRAVSCALEIQMRAGEYAVELQGYYEQLNFAVRIGISTGRVVVGTIGTESKSETLALGTTTNLASRLQSLAPRGEVVVDSETQLRTRADFDFAEQHPTQLKGFAEPVVYYIVIGQLQQANSQLTSNRVAGVEIPFVGRDATYRRLLDGLRHVRRDKQPLTFVIYGDIGIGKSRLLQEIINTREARGFYIVRMIGYYERRETSYSLLRNMIASLCRLNEALTPAAVEQRIIQYTLDHWNDVNAEAAAAVVGYLAGLGFRDNAYTQSIDRTKTDSESYSYTWVRRWLRGLAGGRPILLILDNLQWADPISIQVVRYLIESEPTMLTLAAARPEFYLEAQHYLENIDAQEVTLPPLTEDATRAIIEAALTHFTFIPTGLTDLIIARAEGNPLFVEEFLRMLFEKNVLKQEDDGWHVDMGGFHAVAEELPMGLLGVFQARLDDLPPSERRVVQAAAVVGQTFWTGAVNNAVGADTTERLARLVERRIITQKPESRFEGTQEYTFRNSLYHDVAYSMLPRSYRVDNHRQVARWLARAAVRQPDALSLLADHYTRAGQPLDAIKTYVAAANYQFGRSNLAESLNLIQAGLNMGGKLESREQATPYTSRLWLLKGQLAYARRRYDESTADSQTAIDVMDEYTDINLMFERVRAYVTLGNAHTSLGDYESALSALTQAYQIVDRVEEKGESAAVLRAFGRLFWVRGNLEEAKLYQQRALLSAQQDGSKREIAAATSMLARIHIDRGNLGAALAMFERVYHANVANGDILYQIDDLRHLATVYQDLFAYSRAQKALDTANALSERINYLSPLLQMAEGTVSIGAGQPEKGLVLLRAAMANEYHNTHDRYDVHLAFLRGLAVTGYADECLTEAEGFIASVRDHSPLLYGRGLLWQGLASFQFGQPGALTTLREALEYEQTHGGRDLWTCHYALSLTCETAAERDEHRATAEAALVARAASLESQSDLYATATNLNLAAAVFAQWQTGAKPS